jgi:hypothetical protein
MADCTTECYVERREDGVGFLVVRTASLTGMYVVGGIQ